MRPYYNDNNQRQYDNQNQNNFNNYNNQQRNNQVNQYRQESPFNNASSDFGFSNFGMRNFEKQFSQMDKYMNSNFRDNDIFSRVKDSDFFAE